MWSGDGVSVWTTNFPESLTLYVDSPVGGDKLKTKKKTKNHDIGEMKISANLCKLVG